MGMLCACTFVTEVNQLCCAMLNNINRQPQSGLHCMWTCEGVSTLICSTYRALT